MDAKWIYLWGILSQEVTKEDLLQAFGAFGKVAFAKIIMDSWGVSRGYGFVEMPAKAEAQAAISGLNSKELKGRTINVTEASPRREERRGGKSRS